MYDSFEESVKNDFVVIMGALAEQRDASREIARHLAHSDTAITRLEGAFAQLRDHVLETHKATKKSESVLADHEDRLRAIERRQPPAA